MAFSFNKYESRVSTVFSRLVIGRHRSILCPRCLAPPRFYTSSYCLEWIAKRILSINPNPCSQSSETVQHISDFQIESYQVFEILIQQYGQKSHRKRCDCRGKYLIHFGLMFYFKFEYFPD
jgi:hypothetical protein